MKKFIWCTDTHLNFESNFSIRNFIKSINADKPDGLILTGDISDGWRIEAHLLHLARNFDFPVYFVLGNHDYYGQYIGEIHDKVRQICIKYPHMCWITEAGIQTIVPGVALIGAEGWYDGGYGNVDMLRWSWDWFLIKDFLCFPNWEYRLWMFRLLAQKSDRQIRLALENAFKTHDKVYVLTHVPPWIQASGDRGYILKSLWSAYNVNKRLGVGIELMSALNPDKFITVLCGHTHISVHAEITRNIEVRVAEAKFKGLLGSKRYIYV